MQLFLHHQPREFIIFGIKLFCSNNGQLYVDDLEFMNMHAESQ
jgi:hypothetical protein